jgi:aspartyl-tRNA(Asn)/glutamyl-tRNA(Gln) amidotransferase subunit A
MLETVKEWISALKTGDLTARDAVGLALGRIAACESGIDAFLSLQKESAYARADAIDAARAAGEDPGPLAGLPVAIKDVICQKDVESTCASRILKHYFPPYDAAVVERLQNAGVIIVGRVNMDEFAMGSSTENSSVKQTRNPWDTGRIPGGSSGGSAAAVAARQVPVALGSDTGGSIRQPAALCGITGLKPTYGCVSRYGLCAYASSLDQIGTLALNVEDTALMLPYIAGYDHRDSTAADLPVPDYIAELNGDIAGLKIGVPKEYFIEGLDPEIGQSVRAGIDTLANLGAEVTEISLPHAEYAIAAYYIIATAEASSNLARYDGIHYGTRADDTKTLADVYTKTRRELFGDEVIRRIILGTYVLSSGYYDAYYLKAQKVRTLIKQDFDRAFESVDIIVTPTSPSPAFKLGEKTSDPLEMYLSDIFTVSVNLAGIPGMSIPCGFTGGNLPIGMQLLAKPFNETVLLKTGHAYQQTTDHHTRRPPVCAMENERE